MTETCEIDNCTDDVTAEVLNDPTGVRRVCEDCAMNAYMQGYEVQSCE